MSSYLKEKEAPPWSLSLEHDNSRPTRYKVYYFLTTFKLKKSKNLHLGVPYPIIVIFSAGSFGGLFLEDKVNPLRIVYTRTYILKKTFFIVVYE